MKTIIFFIILFYILSPNLLFSQSKSELESKIVKLEEKLESSNKKLNNDKESLKSELVRAKEENDSLKQLFHITYEKFGFYTAFENKYSNNYFKTTKFQKIGNAIDLDIQNADLMIRFILMYGNEESARYNLARESRAFNLNWIVLDSITNNVIIKRYDSIEVSKAIQRIENLPSLDQSSEMNSYKQRLKSLLTDYDSINCIASKEFENMSEGMSSLMEKGIALKDIQKNLKFNKDRIATEYNYLHTVYEAIKSNPNNYKEEEYSLPNTCPKEAPKVEIIEEEKEEVNDESSEFKNQKSAEINFEKAFFVDVRSNIEYSAGSFEGAENIPLDSIEKNIEKFKRRDQVVIFSDSEHTSSIAIDILAKNGITNVINGISKHELEKLKGE